MSVTEFEALGDELLADADRDVTREGSVLLVHGQRFAYLDGDLLAVRLPTGRAQDLVSRGIAEFIEAEDAVHWVTVPDHQNWRELASEAHTLAHGKLPGGDS